MKSGEAWGVLILFATSVLLPPLGAAHTGQGGSISATGRLEAEKYSNVNAACDPGPGGAHTQVIIDASTFGGAYVRMPSGACMLTFPPMMFPGRMQFEHYRGRAPGDGNLGFRVVVFVDGVKVAEGEHVQNGWSPWVVQQFSPTQPVSAGLHTVQVRVGATIAVEKWLDLVGGQMNDASCVENVPTTPQVERSDGFGDGRWGWKFRSYTLEGSPAREADGDPVSNYEWRWGDGTKTNNRTSPTGTHSYSQGGLRQVTLTAYDNPTGRCPVNLARSDPYAFNVVADWSANIDRPRARDSCLDNRAVPTPLADQYPVPNVVLLRCTFEAEVSAVGIPRAFAEALFVVDGLLVGVDSVAPYRFEYNATKFPTGNHELEACFRAQNDKHERVFCSGAYPFLSLLELPKL